MAREAEVSRETLRKIPRRNYEIRDTDGTVLSTVSRQMLLEARAEQLAHYLQAGPSRTNIRMVDVTDLLPAT